MVINLNQLPQYREAINQLSTEIANGADKARQEELFSEAFNTLGSEINQMAEEQLETLFAARNRNSELTASEIEFFDYLAKVEDNPGVKTEKIIPEEVMIRVFEDLRTERPLLSIIKFKNTGLRLKALVAKTNGEAKWGPIYGEIKGQLKQEFDEVNFGMNKLTAFVAVPKDALKFSYKWLKEFIIEQLKEAIAVAVEISLINGDGENQMVGLIKDLSKPTPKGSIVTYPTDKTAIADLSNVTPETGKKLLAPVMKALATETLANGKQKFHNIDGKVYLVVNPVDRWDLEAKLTALTDNGGLTVTNPYGIKIVESAAIASGKAVAFVDGRYDAFTSANATIEEFDQTFALEDLQLFTTKSYYYGKAKDNSATAVLTLAGG